MTAIRAILGELIGLFVDDDFLALAILAVVAVAAALALLAGLPMLAGAALVVGCVGVLLASLFRARR